MLQDIGEQVKAVKQELSQDASKVSIVTSGKAATIYIDSEGKDYNGLKLVVNSFIEDVNMITGVTPDIVSDIKELDGTAVIAGTIGNNNVIDSLILKGVIDVIDIKNKRECYKIQVVENPTDKVDKAIVVVGSEKRGTIYGIYHISELIGVSPWIYWGDVVPAKQKELAISKEQLNITSKEPSVKYRGFFLNDEWPSLGTWVTNKFGDFNEEFYDKVFQLILRLKGNFLWPAMWSAVFSENGKSRPIENAQLADTYGIVIGTSHHEPMFRAGEEWKNINERYGTNSAWDFTTNSEAITKFWEDGLLRNKDFESLITIGMRGEQDSALEGSEKENIELLKKIIITQKSLLKKHGMEIAPKVLTIYKEVEKYWYGSDEVEGLRHWDVLDDVTIMLADDNFANVRTLPDDKERNRKAGWGMYYHFDYHGGPRSYEWVNTTPLEKAWEQMSMAYDYGVRDIWIVNVGDLKPMEFPISYFMDLAYDFEAWGTNGINKTREYTKKWASQQFGNNTEEELIDGITAILSDYTEMNGSRKPEVTFSNTYSCINYNEAQRVLAKAIGLENRAEKFYKMVSEASKDAYYQLVYYPTVASVNVVKMQIYAGLNNLYYESKSILANEYYALVQKCIEIDNTMQNFYNNNLSNGKWNGMMSSPHIGYTYWNPDGWTYPEFKNVIPKEGSYLIVNVEGSEKECCSGTASLPVFTNLCKECYAITISNGGNTAFDYTIETSADWIKVDNTEGSINGTGTSVNRIKADNNKESISSIGTSADKIKLDNMNESISSIETSADGIKAVSIKGSIVSGKNIMVSIDWDKVSNTSKGYITIYGTGEKVQVNVTAEFINTDKLLAMTFVETHGVIAIEAEHAAKMIAKSNVKWKVIKNYGRTLSSVKMFPTTVSFVRPEDAPYLEYLIEVSEDKGYTLTTYVAPTNNLYKKSRLKYGVSFDGGIVTIADALPQDFVAGDYDNEQWCDAVLDNIHVTCTKHMLTKGTHTLRLYGLDAGLVLQKLVLSKQKLPASFFGPQESFFVNKN